MLFFLFSCISKTQKGSDAPNTSESLGETKDCLSQGGQAIAVQCQLNFLKEQQLDCEKKSPDYEWISDSCIKLPNFKLTGTEQLTSSFTWKANSDNCDKDLIQGKNLFNNCSGMDLKFLPRNEQGQTKLSSVYIQFSCPDFSAHSPHLLIGTKDFALTPRTGPQSFSIEQDSLRSNEPMPTIEIKWEEFTDAMSVGISCELKIQLGWD